MNEAHSVHKYHSNKLVLVVYVVAFSNLIIPLLLFFFFFFFFFNFLNTFVYGIAVTLVTVQLLQNANIPNQPFQKLSFYRHQLTFSITSASQWYPICPRP